MKVKKTTTGILATATLCVFASSARAGTVNLYDGTFSNLTFVQSTANRPYGFGPSQTTSITAGVMSGNVDNLQADPNAISVQFTVSIRARPRTGAHPFKRLRSSGSSLCILMSSVRFSMPKSVNAITWSSPMP